MFVTICILQVKHLASSLVVVRLDNVEENFVINYRNVTGYRINFEITDRNSFQNQFGYRLPTEIKLMVGYRIVTELN